KVTDTDDLRPMIHQFFHYENKMLTWLKNGIWDDDFELLQQVIDHDQYVNRLNKNTYNELVFLINQQKTITESKLKTGIISCILECIVEHLVNASRIYLKVIKNNI